MPQPHTGSPTLLGFVRGWLGSMLRIALCLGLGTALGLALTAHAIRHGTSLGTVRLGAWLFMPEAGSPEINPYLRAHFSHTGQIPMAAAAGVMFVADQDSAGNGLRRDCRYRLTGEPPQAGFWTLEAADPDGFPLAAAPLRSSFTSAEILRQTDGQFVVEISPSPQPGNWLPSAGSGHMLLVLRLYDTSVAALGIRDLRLLPLPAITPSPCA